ncbi:hypothetical protein GCM10010421_10220 [Streptomyces glaucus]|uniref:Transposase n=1 Tax=Streptomyces glaucus TaxID=284029 RepID=A0ABN3J9W6_9ACTN
MLPKSKVDLYAAIRRDAKAGLSIRALQRKYGVGFLTVKEAQTSAWSEPRKKLPPRPTRLDPYKPLIDEMLRADLDAPRKQRHTVKRIFERLLDEHGADGISYQMVRGCVADRREEIRVRAGRGVVEAFVPQTHKPGAEAEVDFGDVTVRPAGELVTCYLFAFRLSRPGKAVHRIFASAGQEVFFEGHVHALNVLGGVPAGKVRYDNLRAAVAQVPGFPPASRRGRTLGRVPLPLRSGGSPLPARNPRRPREGRGGGPDRLVPPQPPRPGARGRDARRAQRGDRPVGPGGREPPDPVPSSHDRRALRGRAAAAGTAATGTFETGRLFTLRVDRYSQISVRTNRYSVPVRLIGRTVRAMLHASEPVVHDGRNEVARHERLIAKGGTRLELDHHLEALVRKPGAPPGATALDQACRTLRLPTIRFRFSELAETGGREQMSYLDFPSELLLAEGDDRARRRSERRIKAADFPRDKSLRKFDFDASPNIDPAMVHTLAKCERIRKGLPLCLIGDSGTDRPHLLIALGTEAAMTGHRVKYVLATKLVDELVEAADEKQLTKTIARYGRVALLCIDELGYMEPDRHGAELLFQILTEREEKNSVAIASNECISGWTKTSPTPASARPSSTASPSAATSSKPAPAPAPAASPPPAPKRNEQPPERSQPALSNGPAFIDDHGRLRQEDIPADEAVSDVECVEPVRPTADSQGAGEPVVQLPADPLPGKQPNCRRPARPRWQPEERLHPSEHSEPITFVPQADTDLAKVLLARTRLETITLGHLDEVGRPGGHLRQRKADRRRVPAGSGLPAPRLLRPRRLDPLHRDVHRTCLSPRAYGRHPLDVTRVPTQLPAASSRRHSRRPEIRTLSETADKRSPISPPQPPRSPAAVCHQAPTRSPLEAGRVRASTWKTEVCRNRAWAGACCKDVAWSRPVLRALSTSRTDPVRETTWRPSSWTRTRGWDPTECFTWELPPAVAGTRTSAILILAGQRRFLLSWPPAGQPAS